MHIYIFSADVFSVQCSVFTCSFQGSGGRPAEEPPLPYTGLPHKTNFNFSLLSLISRPGSSFRPTPDSWDSVCMYVYVCVCVYEDQTALSWPLHGFHGSSFDIRATIFLFSLHCACVCVCLLVCGGDSANCWAAQHK